MSAYKYTKAVRLKVDFEIEKELKSSDEDCFKLDYNHYGVKEQSSYGYIKCFDTIHSDTEVYIDYIINSSYGDESGEWYNSRNLTEYEFQLIEPIFSKIYPSIKKENLRVVDYCYYNCSEPNDCFNVDDVELDYNDIYDDKQ